MMSGTVRVRFWGVRGSIASPGPGTARYGGNTSCVEVQAADDTRIVLDCGTGARELGLHLARAAPGPLRIHLLIGHTHWDHIQGFPFFTPAFLPGSELDVYAPLGFQRGLEEALAGQMERGYFPVRLRELKSRIRFTELDEGFLRIGDVLVETQYLNHTAPTIAYRLSSRGATVAYVTDHEPFWDGAGRLPQHPGDERHVAFMRGADLVIHDAQYTAEEYQTKVGWGHSSVEYAVDVAMAAGVARLVLFHHDPAHDDAEVDRMQALASARASAAGSGLEVRAAAEGLELEIQGRGVTPAITEASALRHRPVAGSRVLVACAEAAEASWIEDVLGEDGLVVLRHPDPRIALAATVAPGFDLAIVDRELLVASGLGAIDDLRRRAARPDLPVIVLTTGALGADAMTDPGSATDYLAKPLSPALLRARVRAWLARTRADETGPAGAPPATWRRPTADDRARWADQLTALPLFTGLGPAHRERLLAQASEQMYAPGHFLLRPDEPVDCVFVVLSGRVRVLDDAPGGHGELVITEIGAGELVGELAPVRDRVRPATVVAIEPTHCLRLHPGDFLKTLHASPELAIGLMRMLAGRLYESDHLLSRWAPDPVTRLPGRRGFTEQYRRLAAAARRRKLGAFLLVVDVRHLREINDRFGYVVGDRALRAVADALVEATRTTDLVARLGGDAFALYLPDVRPEDLELVVDRLQAKVEQVATARGLPVTPRCSVGAVYTAVPPTAPDDLLREADLDMRRRRG